MDRQFQSFIQQQEVQQQLRVRHKMFLPPLGITSMLKLVSRARNLPLLKHGSDPQTLEDQGGSLGQNFSLSNFSHTKVVELRPHTTDC